VIVVGAVLASTFAPPAAAQAPALEHEVKAAFLLNFARFAEWPASTFANQTAPINICVVRPDPFGDTIDGIVRGEVVQGRGVAVRRVAADESIHGCHVLFVPSAVQAVAPLLRSLRAVPTLTVGETDTFLPAGGTVSFFLEAGKVRFAMNPDAAERSGVRISSHLLRLARIARHRQEPS
jgi:hypothetical protein